MFNLFRRRCNECALPVFYHLKTWLDELLLHVPIGGVFFQKIGGLLESYIERFLIFLRLLKVDEDYSFEEIELRSVCFISEARKRGVAVSVLRSGGVPSHVFYADFKGRRFRFENLPGAEFLSKKDRSFTECKECTKQELTKAGFPVSKGKTFWFFEQERALRYGMMELGYPLVVKPRSGSVARHVSVNITNEAALRTAICSAVRYSPAFMIERFVSGAYVYRATVVDFDKVFCVRQVPANVIGDGKATIQELVALKNLDVRRDSRIYYPLVCDGVTDKLLALKDYSLDTILAFGERFFLQEAPFLRLGGDLEEVTEAMHADNAEAFRKIAKHFDMRLVGIDFMIPEISRSYREQESVVLELNSVPCIEMHHFPLAGRPQNVAEALIEMFLKYYSGRDTSTLGFEDW